MTVKAYIKAYGKVREIKGFFAKKNGKVMRIKEIYAGRNGAKQLVFQAPTELFEPLDIITAKDIIYEGIKLPKGTFSEEYNAKIQAAGGTGVYRFDLVNSTTGAILVSRVWIKGIKLYPDGTLCGVPEETGVRSVRVRVTDSSGASFNKSIALRINQKDINFYIYDNRPVYDGLPHDTIRVVSSLSEITEDDYVVEIDGEEPRINAGTYGFKIKLVGEKAKYYRIAQGNSGFLVIVRNDNSKISLKSQTVTYDGKPHSLIPVVSPAEIQNDYKVTYVGKNGTVYEETEQPPTEIGTYTVKAETTNTNYMVKKATATLTITE